MAEQPTCEPEQGFWDWTSVYKTELLTDIDDEYEQPDAEQKKPVSAACSHDHSAERAIYDLSLDDKIRKMNLHQSKGNSFFEEGQYDRALVQYKQAMIVYEYTFPEDDETWRIIDQIRFNCNLNVAASANELGLWSETTQNCYEALRVDPINVKALYRRAQAYRKMDNFEESKSDIVAALRQRPHDFQLREEFSLLKSQIKAYNDNSKKMAEKMIGKEKKLPSNIASVKIIKPHRTARSDLLDARSNTEALMGIDNLDDPVMYDMGTLNTFIGGVDTCGNQEQYLRPGQTTTQLPAVEDSPRKESWVFGDLNRPGAFVRQRPRTKKPGAPKKDCLCCA